MGNQLCGEGTAWKESEMKCFPQSAFIVAQATNGYDLATGHCDLDTLDVGKTSVKVSDCYATCASNADCAAFVFQHADPGNTTCWFKTTSNDAASNTCAASSGLSSENKLVPTANSALSYYEVKSNSV